jgi:hypothetical protein
MSDVIGKVRVANYWPTEDVQAIAPGLSDEQAAAVLLLACVHRLDAEVGVNWDVLREHAYDVQEDWSPGKVTEFVRCYRDRLEAA